jgi:hypothetical protein
VTAESKTNRFGVKYTYYHCSKRRKPRCGEPCIEVRKLEAQFLDFLKEIRVADDIHDWSLSQLDCMAHSARERMSSQSRAIKKSIAELDRRQGELVDMRSRRLIDDANFLKKRNAAQRELFRLQQSLASQEEGDAKWFELAKLLILFSNRAVSWFEAGTDEQKRLIIRAVGSNPTLTRKIVSIQARKIFRHMPRETNILSLRALVQNIRKMDPKGDSEEQFAAIKRAESLLAVHPPSAQKPAPPPSSGAFHSRAQRPR